MFEYMYLRDFAPLILLFMALSINMLTTKIKHQFIYSIAIVFIVALLQNIYYSTIFEENIELFNQNKQLECRVDGDKYLVQKSDNNSIQKHYFLKDERLMLIVDCEEF